MHLPNPPILAYPTRYTSRRVQTDDKKKLIFHTLINWVYWSPAGTTVPEQIMCRTPAHRCCSRKRTECSGEESMNHEQRKVDQPEAEKEIGMSRCRSMWWRAKPCAGQVSEIVRIDQCRNKNRTRFRKLKRYKQTQKPVAEPGRRRQ
jgi:hypothetical protein